MKKLIVNADDFGYGLGVNRGIIEGHQKGIITSTTLLVGYPADQDAARLAKENPKLGVGLHYHLSGPLGYALMNQEKAPQKKVAQAKKTFFKQVKDFKKLLGRMPDHIDGHFHAHLFPTLFPFVADFANEHKLPLRAVGQVAYIDEFFGRPDLKKISLQNLIKILKNLPEGISELLCHPGYVTPDLKSKYAHQREIELKTLVDPKIKVLIKKEKIKLINFSQVERAEV